MNITSAFILFAAFIFGYIIIWEIFTVLFRLTGMTEEKARFEVISMLTNSGYTTGDSEIVVSSKKRRLLAKITILFGYSFTVTIVSIVVNIFLNIPQTDMINVVWIAVVILFMVIVLYMIKKFRFIKERFDKIIKRIGNRIMFGKGSNPLLIVNSYRGSVMAQIELIHMPKLLQDKTLHESGLRKKHKLQLLAIYRDGNTISEIDGNVVLKNKDEIIVFGNHKEIRCIFEKPECENYSKLCEGV